MRGKLPSLSSQRLIAALRRAGFEDAPRRGKGSHHALMRRDANGRIRLVILPERRDLPGAQFTPSCRKLG